MLQTRSMTLSTVALAVAAVTVGPRPAAGHVAPSVDDNNRYLKVTPLRDGFRLAYTVFFGEIPGAAERRGIDSNRDGRLDDAEAHRFGNNLASQVAASLVLEVGTTARPVPVTWSVVDVGLGSAAVTAGSFSVDMVAYVCAAGRIRLRDSFRIPRPGETEVKVEDSPGVTLTAARVGPADDPQHDYKFLGAGGPLTDDGLEVVWTARPDAPALTGVDCSAAGNGTAPSRHRPWWPFAIGGVLGAVAAVVVLVRRRRLTAS